MKKIFSKVPVTKIISAGLLASVILLPLSARAEIKEGSFEVNPFAGYNFFENGQNLKDSFIYGGRLGYNITKNVGVEGTVEFVNSRVDDKSRIGAKEGQYRSPTDGVDLAFYHLDLLYHFMPDSKFTPFIVAGLGGVHYSPRIATQDMTAINFGVGAKYWVADNIALRVDLRDTVVSEVFQEAYHNVNATAGIVFAFGGTPKSSPAAVGKNKDTTAPYVTLTSPMKASTDVSSHVKVSVAFSEAIDPATINAKTVTLYQGKTVVPGKVNAPTDRTASFVQASDLTPGTSYTGRVTTGVKDVAGNALASDYVFNFKTAPIPDPSVKTKTVIINKLVMLEDTHFEFDKADLTPSGKEMIKQNIQIMKDNPALKIRIAGYTSAAGTTEYNQVLSERRANNVMTYMIQEGGVAPARLDAIGYGKTRPAMYEVDPSEHESKAAKANMKVLFEIIVK